MTTKTIDDVWDDFLKWTQSYPAGAYLFRGQADASDIVPKIGRPVYKWTPVREEQLYKAFERAVRPFLQAPMKAFELLALAQHHGAPTRLADWSTTPLVAAWFAVSSYPLDQDAQVYALDLARPDLDWIDTASYNTKSGATIDHPLKPLKGVYLIETAQVSDRITTQRGIFTLHGDPTVPLTVPAAETFSIPSTLRVEFQGKLMDFGIDESHIYPDIDGMCRNLDWRFKNNKSLSAFA